MRRELTLNWRGDIFLVWYPRNNPELDANVANQVLDLEVVGMCVSYDSDGTGESIHRPDENIDGEVRPVFVGTCSCQNGPHLQIEDFESAVAMGMSKESIDKFNEDNNQQYLLDKEIWGHSRYCLVSVPKYSSRMDNAWVIVREMAEQEFLFELNFIPYNPLPWIASFISRTSGEIVVGKGFGEDAAETICKAALNVIQNKSNPVLSREG